MGERFQELSRLFRQTADHRLSLRRGESLKLVEQFQLLLLFFRVVRDLPPLLVDFGLIHFAFRFRRKIRAAPHRKCGRYRGRKPAQEDELAVGVCGPRNAADNAEGSPETIVDAVYRLPDPSSPPDMPSFPSQDTLQFPLDSAGGQH